MRLSGTQYIGKAATSPRDTVLMCVRFCDGGSGTEGRPGESVAWRRKSVQGDGLVVLLYQKEGPSYHLLLKADLASSAGLYYSCLVRVFTVAQRAVLFATGEM